MGLALIIGIWLLVAGGVVRTWSWLARTEPDTAPRGGLRTIIGIALVWPMIVALSALAVLALFVRALRG